MARQLERYRNEIVPALMKRFGYRSVMEVPRLSKIVLNMGLSEAVSDKKVMDYALDDLTRISGQKPVVSKARKAVAGFSIREGVLVGCFVTLRRVLMHEFFDRLITVALPRVRDFRGLPSKSFDGRGNYSLGVKEQIIFPEVDYDKIDVIRGLDVTIVTTAKTDAEALALLQAFGLPIRMSGGS